MNPNDRSYPDIKLVIQISLFTKKLEEYFLGHVFSYPGRHILIQFETEHDILIFNGRILLQITVMVGN